MDKLKDSSQSVVLNDRFYDYMHRLCFIYDVIFMKHFHCHTCLDGPRRILCIERKLILRCNNRPK